MQKTNLIGALISLVDRFAHLDSVELTRLKDDAADWYNRTKAELFEESGKPKKDREPSTFKEKFVSLSEKWYIRLIVGLVFVMWVLPWARRVANRDQADHDETTDRRLKKRDRILKALEEEEFEDDYEDDDDYYDY